jgi:hypothetical protein
MANKTLLIRSIAMGGLSMKKFLLAGILSVFLITVRSSIASSPAIVGELSGVELCPESVCDAAIFTGTCDCIVNKRHTVGFFWVAIQHEPLPNPSASSDILGGKWTLTTLNGNFSGRVIGGTIANTNNETFKVTATLRLQKGGKGDLIVSGVLDHSDFPPSPPTFDGELSQP